MDAARAWLDAGRLLDSAGAADPAALAAGAPRGLAGTVLNHLVAIQDELAALPERRDHSELISIAVDDMRVVSALVKLVIVYGLYPHVPDGSMVPLQPRIAWPLPPKVDQNGVDQRDLRTITAKLVEIALRGDDLSSLVLISPSLVDILAAASFFPDLLAPLVAKIPTFTLYKLFIQLRSCPAPQPALVHALGELPVRRNDAVRTLIELVIEPKSDHAEQDAQLENSSRAAQVLAAVPPDVSKVAYIRAVGTQVFALLAGSAGTNVADASARVVAALSTLQPRLLGELRNLLVLPFETAGSSAAMSIAALLRLAGSTDAHYSAFFGHVATRIGAAVWLLLGASKSELKAELDSTYLALMARILESSPEATMKNVFQAFTVDTIPNTRLAWTSLDTHQPALIDVIGGTGSEHSGGLLPLIDSKLDVLVTVIAKVSDSAATSILTFVLQLYVDGSIAADPLVAMVLAKTAERLAKDANLRPKLFSDPDQIIQLSFKLISANVGRQRPTGSAEPTISSLNIADGDSDDEDDEDESTQVADESSEESQALLELSLSLLGSALMESLGKNGEHQPKISETHVALLTRLSRDYPKSVRSKADFCLQLIDGSRREMREVDMDNNAEVLAAARGALQEPLVPSRAYGLYLYTKLVERHAVSLNVAMSAFVEELKDDDSYVYLNAIKGIETAARVGDSSKVMDFLIPVIDSQHGALDVVLRAREALIRIISPGTATRLSAQLVETLLSDLRASARETRDIRFRLSSCSLLGIVIANYPHALSTAQENDAADCALGILRYEQAPEEEVLRKAAVILALEIVNAVNEGAFAGALAKKTLSSLMTEIEHLMHHTSDTVLLEHCRAVMESARVVA